MAGKESELKKLEGLIALGKLANKFHGIDPIKALKELKEEWFEEFRKTLPQSPIDYDALAAKVIEKLPVQQPVDNNAIIEQLIAQIAPGINAHIEKSVSASEIRISTKVAEAMEILNKKIDVLKVSSGQIDPQVIIKGVVDILQPNMAEEIRKASEVTFTANSKALMEAVNQRFEQASTQENKQVTQPPGGGLLSNLLNNPDIVGKIIDKLLGAPVPQTAMLSDFNRLLSFHDLMTKIEKRQATGEEIAKTFTNITSPNPAPPALGQAPK